MSIPSFTTKSFEPQASPGGDQVATAFDTVARSAQHTVDNALNRISAQAEAAARRGLAAGRDSSRQLRDKAMRASDSTIAYVKDEPVKSVLIAVATGALLMGFVSLLGRSRQP